MALGARTAFLPDPIDFSPHARPSGCRGIGSLAMSLQTIRTASGLRIRRRAVRLDYAAGLGFLAERLDRSRGAYFSSGVEDPDRYSRWEFGFADPPLEIVGRGRALTLNALNRRGEILLALLAPALGGEGLAIVRRDRVRIELAVARAAGRFPE